MTKHLPLVELDSSFAPFTEGYLQCLEKGFTDYRKLIDFKGSENFEVFTSFDNYIKCGIVQKFFWAHAQEYFKGNSLVKIGVWNKIEGAILNGKWFIRFNKINKHGKIGGINTPQRDDFFKQKSITGMPKGVTYVVSGYKPNDAWTEVENTYFACWNDTQLKWMYEVGGRFEKQADIAFPEETNLPKREFILKNTNKQDVKTGTKD